jgi:hypothetical protein
VRGDVQTVALTVPAGNAGAGFSFNASAALAAGELVGAEITEVTGLPEGLTYQDGVISGNAAAGYYTVSVSGTRGGQTVQVPVTLQINNADGSAPAGVQGGSAAAVEGSLGGGAQAEGQAGAQLTTGSDGTDAILGAVLGIVTSLGVDAGSAAEMAAGSTGNGEVAPGAPGETSDSPGNQTGPLSSLAGGEIDLGSLTGGNSDTPETLPVDQTPETPDTGSLGLPGSSATVDGEVTGETTGGLDTQSLGPLGSLLESASQTDQTGQTGQTGSTTDGQTGGDLTVGGNLAPAAELVVPGSSVPVDTGSLGTLAPGLALTGAALLGLAGLSLVLNGGSSMPGSSTILPALPGSTTTGGTTTGGSSDSGDSSETGGSSDSGPGGSLGSVAPTVAAGAPNTVQAPGPTVANGRG